MTEKEFKTLSKEDKNRYSRLDHKIDSIANTLNSIANTVNEINLKVLEINKLVEASFREQKNEEGDAELRIY
jgi:hypothetical protein